MRMVHLILIGSLGLCSVAAVRADDGSGLVTNADNLPWTRWHGRVAVNPAIPAWRSDFGSLEPHGLKTAGLSLMGDYYFTRPLFGLAGGFRATSGVIVGSRSPWWTAQAGLAAAGGGMGIEPRLSVQSHGILTIEPGIEPPAAAPYIGFGYSGLSGRGGWSFSADVGMIATTPAGAVEFGQSGGVNLRPDESLRDRRTSPVLQLGVSRTF